MENTKIEKSEVAVMVLDTIDSVVFGSLLGRAVLCFMPRSTKKIIDLVYITAFTVFGSKVAGLAWEAMADKVHEVNENIVDSIGDLADSFKAIRAQKKEA